MVEGAALNNIHPLSPCLYDPKEQCVQALKAACRKLKVKAQARMMTGDFQSLPVDCVPGNVEKDVVRRGASVRDDCARGRRSHVVRLHQNRDKNRSRPDGAVLIFAVRG